MTPQRAAELQVLLEGVPLPATKQALVEYARRQDGSAVNDLQALPDREFRSLDEVGEALVPVQPPRVQPVRKRPHEESGATPGDDSYLDPRPEPGAIRPGIPPENPPQQTLEQQTKTQQEQQERQRQLG